MTTGISGATVIGTYATEIPLLKKRLGKAKAIIAKDVEELRFLETWLVHLSDLAETLEDELGFDLLQKICEQSKALFEEYRHRKYKIDVDFVNKLDPLLDSLVDLFLPDSRLLAKFGVECAPAMISFILAMFILPMGNSVLIDWIPLIQGFQEQRVEQC
ncbi:uncharacterized protein CEXT_694601 [Caerostris extrusa]|uniref:Uncharacterized protein n=1 Tax=Caerostris extrusa TaxID=172846 RepID=A0AAV4VE54_CAEEX|nr:uncharacterized protein CEXT_694601 [Caerostris extrusa]